MSGIRGSEWAGGPGQNGWEGESKTEIVVSWSIRGEEA
jgi:hypothetical protein